MKERILTGWTITRALYVLMGVFVIVQSFMQHEWIGIIFGGYFASMGVFSFGCAAGNCTINPNEKNTTPIQDVAFEEVKQK